MLIAASLAAPVLTGGVTADGTYGSDAQTPHAYPNGVLAGQASFGDVAGGGRFLFDYNPRLTLSNSPDPGASHVAFFQTGTAAYTIHDGTELYSFSQAASYGQQDFSLLSQSLGAGGTAGTTGTGGTGGTTGGIGGIGGTTQPGQTTSDRRPLQRFISTLNSVTSASLQELFSPRATGTLRASFSVGGGQGSVGRATLPLQRSGSVSLGSAFLVTRLDTFSVTAIGTESLTGGNQESRSVDALLVWARTFDPDVRGSAGVGMAVLYNNVATQTAAQPAVASAVGSQGTLVAPTGLASLAWNVPVRAQHIAFSLGGAVQPALDPFTGATYLRGNARFNAAWTPVPKWTISASAIGDRVLGGSLSGAYGAGGEGLLVHQLSPSASAHLGLRAARVAPDHPLLANEGPPSLWAVLAGFTTTLPGEPRR